MRFYLDDTLVGEATGLPVCDECSGGCDGCVCPAAEDPTNPANRLLDKYGTWPRTLDSGTYALKFKFDFDDGISFDTSHYLKLYLS